MLIKNGSQNAAQQNPSPTANITTSNHKKQLISFLMCNNLLRNSKYSSRICQQKVQMIQYPDTLKH